MIGGQSLVIEKALDGHDDSDPRVKLPWKDGTKIFPVVKVPLSSVLLNPDSHRIKADLESHDRLEIVRTDPYGSEAQAIITDLLANQEGFGDLKRNLKEEGQRDHGVIARNGRLVNANRRAVALRQLDSHGYIDVAVLPPDAGAAEIDRLELKLQVSADLREDYTFTNELLFVFDLVHEHGFNKEKVAAELRWAKSSSDADMKKGRERVDQHLRILGYIRDLQARCGKRLKLSRFDEAKESLQDLDRRSEMIVLSDPYGAQRLRDARLAGILVGLGYKPLRSIDENFVEHWLVDVLAEDDTFGTYADQLTSPRLSLADSETPPGLKPLGDDVTQLEPSPAAILEAVLEATRENYFETPDKVFKIEKSQLERSLFSLFSDAVEDCRETTRTETQLDRPAEYLRQALGKLTKAAAGFEKVGTSPDFNKGAFQYQARKVLQRATELKKQADNI